MNNSGDAAEQIVRMSLEGTEVALRLTGSAAKNIAGIPNVALISVGSDGTDGPTDAAGGFVDGNTLEHLKKQDMDYEYMLKNNDSYHALKAIDGLVMTGPTGTNVNDVVIGLIG